MTPQPRHTYEYPAVRGGADLESLALGVNVAPFASPTDKDQALWHKIRPLTLSLLGLALAVFFWGLQYKASLYHAHTQHGAQMGVAKLWVGPRKAVFVKSNFIKSPAPGAHQLHLLAGRRITTSDSDDDVLSWEAEQLPGGGRCSLQRSPRSPPAL